MILLSASTTGVAAESTLSANTTLSTEGYFTLTWTELPAGAVLQAASAADFSDATDYPVVESGSMTLSGYPDGTWYFRAGLPDAWSGVQSIEVRHHSLTKAFSFFLLGLALFIILAVVITRGNASLLAGEPNG